MVWTRWWILAALVLLAAINPLGRPVRGGPISAAAMIGVQFLMGALMDRLGPRLGMAVAALCQVTPLGLFAIDPGANKAIGQWFPPRERPVAAGVLLVGGLLGSMVNTPLLWTAVLSLVWIVLWIAVVPKIAAPYADLESPRPSTRDLLRQPSVWVSILPGLLVGFLIPEPEAGHLLVFESVLLLLVQQISAAYLFAAATDVVSVRAAGRGTALIGIAWFIGAKLALRLS